ncbi:nicotinate phosphoribosyltransferase-like protein [Candidatus Magnetoovum chiemensis]|nr:nicotinate phosphoribosyltransferase-like protein [Candidatus Magnetoovum chiemensis]
MLRADNFIKNPLLTDLYQITMAYAYWKNARHEQNAVFDLFFRKNPFNGEFAVFAGLDDVLNFVSAFKYTKEDADYLRKILPNCEDSFFNWLLTLDCSKVKIYALEEASIVYPKLPLIRVEGPLAICQLLETTLLTLVNYATLVTTNAARYRLAAGFDKQLLEFGLRRAQGPNGAMSASKYCYMGGFDATSNLLAGKTFNIPVKGTHAHSFVQSYTALNEITSHTIKTPSGIEIDFVKTTLNIRSKVDYNNTNNGELAAFIVYALAFPNNFLALADTYDTIKSGVPNFICTAAALIEAGYKPIGIRLDSGDLAALSIKARELLISASNKLNCDLSNCIIAASSDINEAMLIDLAKIKHEINVFGIGTHLVTCYNQPALGAVYKLVEINGQPRIKVSQDLDKITIPCKKDAFRLYSKDGQAIMDVLTIAGSKPPKPKEKNILRDPFNETKRICASPESVKPLYSLVWDGTNRIDENITIAQKRNRLLEQLKETALEHEESPKHLNSNLWVSQELYNQISELRLKETPII